MTRSSDDLPAPLAPRPPILAAGNIEMLIPDRTSRSGGWNRRRSRMVKMNWGPMPGDRSPERPGSETRNGPGVGPGPLQWDLAVQVDRRPELRERVVPERRLSWCL